MSFSSPMAQPQFEVSGEPKLIVSLSSSAGTRFQWKSQFHSLGVMDDVILSHGEILVMDGLALKMSYYTSRTLALKVNGLTLRSG